MRVSQPILALAAAALVASGCTVGPDYQTPIVEVGDDWAELPAEIAEEPSNLAAWWRTLGDPVLDRLIESALEGNLDLRRAEAKIAEARALRDVVAGGRSPRVGAEGAVIERRQSENGPLPIDRIPGLDRDQTIYEVGFDARWEIDVAGRSRRSIEAANARQLTAVEVWRGVQVRVVAEVARTYLGLRGAQHRLKAVESSVEASRRTHGLVRQQLEAGEVAEARLAQAEAELAALEARLPALEAEVKSLALALGILVGELPEAELALAKNWRDPIELEPLPVGARADLLRRRPDVRAAERRLAASTAEVGVATADLFPRLSINASGGFQAMDVGDLLESASQTWELVPFLSWRIFEGGRVRAEIRAAEARTEDAALAYEQAVLGALTEAERALVRYRYGLEALKRQGRALGVAEESYGYAEDRYRAGETALLELLDAERVVRDAEEALAVTHTRAATDLVALYKALGGGWDAAASTASTAKNGSHAILGSGE